MKFNLSLSVFAGLSIGTCVVFFGTLPITHGASLFLSPDDGSFTVQNTLTTAVILDTEGESVNAFELFIKFPPDKLQVVSPSTGQSIVGVWVDQPTFNNQTGRIEFKGGVPGGIVTDRGVIASITFRAKGVGEAIVRPTEDSRIFRNDGKATDVFKGAKGGSFLLRLPAPQGPLVFSETHPDQSKWYLNSSVSLEWTNESGTLARGYSYILNNNPIDVPDDIPEGTQTSVIYRDLPDGRYYFHIKSLSNEGLWGRVTHYAFKIDASPPAEFRIAALPKAKTSRRQPILQFQTTDAESGLDHYEMKVIPLRRQGEVLASLKEESQPIFFEAQSPYLTSPLFLGSYDVIVRAYDVAGNYRDSAERIRIVSALFRSIGDEGLEVKELVVIPWMGIWSSFALLIFLAGYLVFVIRRSHKKTAKQQETKDLPDYVREKIDELNKYRSKYGTLIALLLAFAALSLIPMAPRTANASEDILRLAPPLVTSMAKDISNEEIFYVGGRVEAPRADVVLYLQNLNTGETISQATVSNERGEWFYRHNTFLSSGDYLLWTQVRSGEVLSPPSPQIELGVRETALHFGASRLSYEMLYLILLFVLSAIVLVLIGFAIWHHTKFRKVKRSLAKEVREAEESIRRGFAVLRRDIQSELALFKKTKLPQSISQEEKIREAQLLKDLAWVESYVGKEVWDIERASDPRSSGAL
ncbi:MAG: cohesin domain-containing protein [Patescibacteria group bacterium]